ncbi:MAG: hypothetical protein JWP35_2224 [Caulobacter sp.]|nr:hypothetical protein [Caulobacter sp.]
MRAAIGLGLALALLASAATAADPPAGDRDTADAVTSARPADRVQAVLDRADKALEDPHADADEAIAGLSGLLDRDALSPKGRARVLIARSMLYSNRRFDSRAALADVDQALALQGPDPAALSLRAGYHDELDEPALALADYNAVLKLAPGAAASLNGRALVEWRLGDFAAAAGDLKAVLAADPQRPYAVIALHLMRVNLKAEDGPELAANIAASGAGATWPAPLFAYFQGRADLPQVLAAAGVPGDDMDATSSQRRTRSGRLCEARYYTAAALLVHGHADEARPLLQQAAAECPYGYVERFNAIADLRRMGPK